jgi:CHAT domain-containing protein
MLKFTLMLLVLGVGVGLPTSIVLTQTPASTTVNQTDELAEAERLHQQGFHLYHLFMDEEKTVTFTERVPKISSALSLEKRALEIRRRILGDSHPDTVNSLTSIGILLLVQRNYNDSEQVLKQSLALLKLNQQNDLGGIANVQNQLALVYVEQGHFDKAETLLLEVLESRRPLLHNYKFESIVKENLFYLGLNYFKQGKYEKARQFFLEPYEIALKLGRRLSARSSMYGLVEALYYQGTHERAIPFFEEMMDIEDQGVERKLLNESEPTKLEDVMYANGEDTLNILLQHAASNSKATELSFGRIEYRKGIILDTLFFKQNFSIANPQVRAISNQRADTQSQLAELYHKERSLTPEQYKSRQAQLLQEISQLSAKISQIIGSQDVVLGMLRHKSNLIANAKEVLKSRIPADSVFIELIRHNTFNLNGRYYEQWENPHYAAYILSSTGLLQSVDLGPARPIDQALQTLRLDLQDPKTPLPQLKASARRLDALLMQPLRPHLGNSHNLLLAPDSTLNLLPFETLVNQQGQYLLETYNITYLTSGRDLLRLTPPKANHNPSLILGDPSFAKSGTLASNLTSRTSNLGQRVFADLPGTKAEATEIAALLNTQPLLGTNASEAAIQQASSPQILHIATHGFFQETNEPAVLNSSTEVVDPFGHPLNKGAINAPYSPNGVSFIPSATPETDKINPLLNSGLILAGFESRQSGGTNDGILTALEVSNLNLTNTKLVTLSACDTGLGSIRNGEGIYGLRRALTLAGAESQTISLWKVSDDATKNLMIKYYTRLKNGEGRSIALHKAQREMLKSEKYSHPYYWAAFIPSGDWRPLNP